MPLAHRLPGSRGITLSAISMLVGALMLACAAALVGMACGRAVTPRSTLPAAGTARDDGSGLLANASSEDTLVTLLEPRDPVAPGREATTDSGVLRDPQAFGGTRYGNYRFAWGERGFRPLPARGHAHGYAIGPHSGANASIRGEIVWRQPPRVSTSLGAAVAGCPSRLANHTLQLDPRARVGHAVVYLEDISVGRRGLATADLEVHVLQLGGTLRSQDCQFMPQVQLLAPLGAKLELISEDPAPSEVIVSRADAILRIPLARGIPERVILPEAGFWRVEDPRLPATAWVVVAAHPYYTVSADDGTFRLDDIPPGHYTLVVWHRPVAFETPDGAVAHGEPLVYKTRVRVTAGQRKQLDIKLPRATP